MKTKEPPKPVASKAWSLDIRRDFRARIKCEVVDAATGIVTQESDWIENLAFDNALSYLVGSSSAAFAGLFTNLKIGSGTTANSYASSPITFTQAANTVTASAGFFTSAMVGAILKYGSGTGGTEQYITGYTSSTIVTVSSSATVGATIGTVWMVTGPAAGTYALATWLATSTGYQTNAGDNSTTVSGGSITLKRTFLFAIPGSTQNINEVGYSDNANADGSCRGRIVLGSTYVVDTSHFFRCVMQLNLTIAPAAPTAVGNVGTNINTAGNVMFEYYDFLTVTSSGGTAAYQTSGGSNRDFMDGGTAAPLFGLRTASWSQPGSIATGQAPSSAETYTVALNAFSTSSQPLGQAVSTTNFSWTTAGETLYGFSVGYLYTTEHSVWTLQLTTPVTLPTGTFQGSLAITKLFTRTLTN